MKREYPYDHQTKRVIRERVALHLKDCISIVDYELDLLHKAMKTKKLKSLFDEPDREVLIQKIKNMTNSSEQQNP
jgi:hypothetical protein